MLLMYSPISITHHFPLLIFRQNHQMN